MRDAREEARGELDWDSLPRYPEDEIGKHHYLQPNDVLVATRMANDITALVFDDYPFPVVADYTFAVVSPDLEKVDPDFLAWQIMSPRAQHFLRRHSRGSTVSNISNKDLGALEIYLPDIDTQRQLSELRRLIRHEQSMLRELQQRHNELLDGVMQRIEGQL